MGNVRRWDREIRHLMEENGFFELKRTLHTTLYTDGVSRIAVATRGSGDPNAIWNVKAELKRMVAKREAAKTESEKNDMKAQAQVIKIKENPEDGTARKIIASAPKPLTASLASIAGKNRPLRSDGRPKRFDGYDPVIREKIGLRVIDLFGKQTYPAMAEILTSEGFRNSEGNILSWQAVAKFAKDLGLSRPQAGKVAAEEKAPAPVTPIPAPSTPPPAPIPAAATHHHISPALVAILKDATLNDTKKVKMLLMYVE